MSVRTVDTLFCDYHDIIPDFEEFQESLRRPLPIHLRVNRLKIEPLAVVRMFQEEGITLKRTLGKEDTLYWASDLLSPGNTIAHFLGYVHSQALTSCLAALALSPVPRSLVLDMCASPGGKTTHMAQLMANTGLIVANDPYTSRQVNLSHNLARMGILNAIVTGYQAQQFPLRERFDFVLVDVPCSGEGTFRKKSVLSIYKALPGRSKLPDLQKRIILRAFDLLKKDGILLYATCTYNPEENESVVDFLIKHREAELFPIHFNIPCEAGLLEWKKERYDRQLRRALRFYPHRVDSVGFFMARIGRKG